MSSTTSSSAQSQEDLVRLLSSKGCFVDERVGAAMRATDRAFYVAAKPASTLRTRVAAARGFKALSYWDRAMGLGFGATISAPRMHARALQLLKDHLTEGKRVLDVGCGSGYLTACMARMVGPEGVVVGVEHIPQLAVDALDKIKTDDETLLRRKTVLREDDEFEDSFEDGEFAAGCAERGDRGDRGATVGGCEVSGEGAGGCAERGDRKGCITLVVGDGRKGYIKAAPYDAIHVGAAATEIPASLEAQLAPGGRLICPVGAVATPKQIETDTVHHTLMAVDKNLKGEIKRRGIMGVIFIPLTDPEYQLNQK